MLQNNTLIPKSKKRVLVVDDEFDIGLWLKTILEGNGFIVDYYCNPLIALKEFKPNFYELLILDIKTELSEAVYFIRKPIENEELLLIINVIVNK